MKALLIIGIVLSSIRCLWSIICFILVKSGRGLGEPEEDAASAWALGFFPSVFNIVVFSLALALI